VARQIFDSFDSKIPAWSERAIELITYELDHNATTNQVRTLHYNNVPVGGSMESD